MDEVETSGINWGPLRYRPFVRPVQSGSFSPSAMGNVRRGSGHR
jgi:hypothetical protein